jgi:hypothetical protein
MPKKRLPTYLVTVTRESAGLTPEDMTIELADSEKELDALIDLHDGRNLGTIAVAIYTLDPTGKRYVCHRSFGIPGEDVR